MSLTIQSIIINPSEQPAIIEVESVYLIVPQAINKRQVLHLPYGQFIVFIVTLLGLNTTRFFDLI